MNIIGFSSGQSGRDSNVDRLVKAILNGSGHPSEFVKLTELNYSACKGCVYLCAKPQVCQLEDDLLPYYQKVKEADAVVLGSPLYFGSVNAGMLAFIERFFGYRHVTIPIRDKPFVLVLSGGGRRFEVGIEQFRRALRPFAVNIVDVVCHSSGIPPCFSCGRHQECRIGGLYGARGESALSLTIRPEMFHRWEDRPDTCAVIEAAATRLKTIQPV